MKKEESEESIEIVMRVLRLREWWSERVMGVLE